LPDDQAIAKSRQLLPSAANVMMASDTFEPWTSVLQKVISLIANIKIPHIMLFLNVIY
jgi:hypothetical protein